MADLPRICDALKLLKVIPNICGKLSFVLGQSTLKKCQDSY